MLITLKTLQQKVFKVEAELSDNVSLLKSKIEEIGKSDHNGIYPKDTQKLIFQGKILEDEKKLEEYQITEKGFIVLMLVKPKVVPKAAPEPTPAATTPAETTTAASEAAAETATPAAPPASTAASTPAEPAAAATPNPMVEQLCAMGFDREQVTLALRAAFNNPDRAVEYLTNGIPAGIAQQATAGSAPTPAGASPAAESAPESGSRLSGATLERIRHEPQFQQIRNLIRTNPHLLEQFIQQLQRENPELFQAITANQEDFVNMLNSAEPGDEPAVPSAGGPNVQEQDGRVTLEVTESERQAIDRLKQLGFREELVIQAYFACDKNEELAANFLLSQTDFD